MHKTTKSITSEAFYSDEEMKILSAIVAREAGLNQLLEYCCTLETDTTIDVLESIIKLRMLSLQVIDTIAAWRRRMVYPQPFLWHNENYLLRMCSDLDFLHRSQVVIKALDGIRLGKRNPFSTIGGLDQSMRYYWQRDLSEEQDLPVLLDTTALARTGSTMDESSQIRLAEWFLLMEEKRYGQRNKAEVAADPRLQILTQKEAYFASKSRFGVLKS